MSSLSLLLAFLFTFICLADPKCDFSDPDPNFGKFYSKIWVIRKVKAKKFFTRYFSFKNVNWCYYFFMTDECV